jgi:membrane protease YdiL (CAAX protease family)
LYELGLVAGAFIALNLMMLIAAQFFAHNEPLMWRFSLWATLGINLVLLAGLGLHFQLRGVHWRAVFGLDATARGRGAVYGLLCYFAMMPPLAVVGGLYAAVCRALDVSPSPQPVVQLLALTDSPWVLALVVGLAVVVAPVFEEVLFRGFAYPAIKQRLGMWKAMVAVSVAFALVHLHTPSAGPLFALGMAFGLAYEITGSILAPILMHSLFNTANVLLLLYVRAQS